MKTPKIFLPLLFLSNFVFAQQSEKRFEIGITPVTVYSQFGGDFIAPNETKVEYLNAINFRYTKNRLGFRAFASYSQYSKDWEGTHFTLFSSNEPVAGLFYNDFKIGAGAQYIFVKRAVEFYSFFDLDYNRINWHGRAVRDCYVGTDFYEEASINAINCYLGLGLKFKIKNTISLSPEISSNIFNGVENNSRTDIDTGKTTDNSYNLSDHHVVLKLHLNYMF